MERLIYTKYSNQRHPDYAIRTDIVCREDGSRVVRKYADTRLARPHIEHMNEVYGLLKKEFAGSRLRANQAKLTDAYIEFEYIVGDTLESALDACLAKDDKNGFAELVKQYASEIRQVYLSEQSVCGERSQDEIERYQKVFGGITLPVSVPFSKGVDIDLIFSNIMVQGNTWTVIDYEWTFDFPVPVDFLLWRAGKVYLENYANRASIDETEMNRMLGVTPENVLAYRQMELHFLQQYCYRDQSDLYALYGTMGQYVMNLDLEEAIKGNENGTNQVQLYYDTGKGYSEAESDIIRIYPDEKGEFHLQRKLPDDLRNLRIDPGEIPCVVYIQKAIGYTENASYELEYRTNGYRFDKHAYVMEQGDPQIYIKNMKEHTYLIEFDYTILADAAIVQEKAASVKGWEKLKGMIQHAK